MDTASTLDKMLGMNEENGDWFAVVLGTARNLASKLFTASSENDHWPDVTDDSLTCYYCFLDAKVLQWLINHPPKDCTPTEALEDVAQCKELLKTYREVVESHCAERGEMFDKVQSLDAVDYFYNLM